METFEFPSGSAARHAGQPLLMLALLVLSLCTTPARGQYIISGRITDQQGGVLPGVTVTATSPQLQGARTVVTTAALSRALRPSGNELVIDLS